MGKVKNNTRQKVIDSLFDDSMKLSYSSLSAFMKSPRHFMEYKLGEKKKTPDMIFGELVHCFVLEPDRVEERYVVIPADAPKRPSITQLNAKEPSDNTIKAIAYWEDFSKKHQGKRIVTSKDWGIAERMKDAVYSNESSAFVLDQITNTEVRVEWKSSGFNWIGFLDGKSDDSKIILDLKTISDASPRKVERAIRYEGYKYQAAHYTIGAGLDYDYYIVAVDKSLHVTTMHVQKTTIAAAWEEIEIACSMMKKCMALNEWEKSYDFWPSDGIYKV